MPVIQHSPYMMERVSAHSSTLREQFAVFTIEIVKIVEECPIICSIRPPTLHRDLLPVSKFAPPNFVYNLLRNHIHVVECYF